VRAILVAVSGSGIPELDEELRLRLGRRFGSVIETWFGQLPAVLEDLAERWGIEWDKLIQGGSMSVVIRCRTADGRLAVVKLSPEPARVAQEAAALASWRTVHVPTVLAVDESIGALMIEAIEPGTPLPEANAYPSLARAQQLAPAIGADANRLIEWCTAFAAMVVLEIAERPGGSREQVEPFLALASRI
jgi:streptomycin 6-kinase